jgi:DNA-binding transcriptional MerR regulator
MDNYCTNIKQSVSLSGKSKSAPVFKQDRNMNNNTKKTDSPETALYPIRTVSDLTDVNAITLRAWERRYELLDPVRKASGHRLYTQAHIDLITRVVGLLDRGMRIGQIKAQLEAENSVFMTSDQVVNDVWKRYVGRMIAAVIQFNEAGLEDVYGEALALYPVDRVTEKLLMPLLAELGRRWEKDEGSIAEEHFFCFYLRNKLGARFHHRVRAGKGPKLLLSCLPGDRHETGLLLFALTANAAGYQPILLGAEIFATRYRTAGACSARPGQAITGTCISWRPCIRAGPRHGQTGRCECAGNGFKFRNRKTS